MNEPSRYARQASATVPLAVGEKLRIDAYNGDGEGTLLRDTYERKEIGLELLQRLEHWIVVRIEQG